VMLHGVLDFEGGKNFPESERMCGELADMGYYAEYIESYRKVGLFWKWLAEIHSGLDALGKNPAVDPDRVALMGFSLGAFLALSTGARDPKHVAAIVEYYGGLLPSISDGAKTMPPTLILHGDKDVVVPVAMAHSLNELLTKYKRRHEMKIYEGANHTFNFPAEGTWYNSADARDAWNRSAKFLAENLGAGPHGALSSSRSLCDLR